jgi:hypothetical protein
LLSSALDEINSKTIEKIGAGLKLTAVGALRRGEA